MDTTIDPPPAPGAAPPPGGPDRDAFRSLASARRSSADRVVAGVCTGIARHLGIDPVVVRVVAAVLVFVGGAGLLLYAAAWFLLPVDDGRPSIAADWFRLGDNEPQVRTTGLVIVGIVAIAAIIGDTGWWWGGPGGPWDLVWLAVPVLFVYWLVAVLPRRNREGRPHPVVPRETVPTATEAPPPPRPPGAVANPAAAHRPPQRMRPPLLLIATLSTMAATLGGLALGAEVLDRDVGGLVFVGVALLVTGAGLVVGSWWGRSWALVPIGVVLSAALAIGSALPVAKVGERHPTPQSAAAVEDRYAWGVGELELDLTDVADPDELLGRTVHLDHGVGLTRVVVPADLAVTVEAEVTGEIVIFDRRRDGHDARLTERSAAGPSLRIVIDQTFGQIEVQRP